MLQSAVRFAPVDVLSILMGWGLALGGLLHYRTMEDRHGIAVMAVAGCVPFLIAWMRARFPQSKTAGVVGDYYPILVILAIFDGLGPFIRAIHPIDRDTTLIAIDRAIFGGDPTVLLEPFATPLLLDVLTLCYVLYYFHPIIMGVLVWRDERRAGATPAHKGTSPFHAYVFTMVLAFYASYVGYFFVPAIGPRFTVTHGGPLPRGTISRVIDETLNKLERNKRNCFPSGHTMITVAVLVEAARRSKKTFLGFLPFALGLFVATVFCRYHYFIDVAAGLVFGILIVPLGHALVKLWDQRVIASSRSPDPLEA